MCHHFTEGRQSGSPGYVHQEGLKALSAAYTFGQEEPQVMKGILARVTKDNVERY